ncbi:MAG TPA: hypothetical protein VNI55_11385 [Gaiellaceae bacterium]|nr:hypothetical protein [Gaiellaceae bacterium]
MTREAAEADLNEVLADEPDFVAILDIVERSTTRANTPLLEGDGELTDGLAGMYSYTNRSNGI